MKKLLVSLILLVSSVSLFSWNNWNYSGKLLYNTDVSNEFSMNAFCYGDFEIYNNEGLLFEDDSIYKDVRYQNVEVSFSDLSRRNVVFAIGEWWDDSLVLQKSDDSLWLFEKMLENNLMFLRVRLKNEEEQILVFYTKNFNVDECLEA